MTSVLFVPIRVVFRFGVEVDPVLIRHLFIFGNTKKRRNRILNFNKKPLQFFECVLTTLASRQLRIRALTCPQWPTPRRTRLVELLVISRDGCDERSRHRYRSEASRYEYESHIRISRFEILPERKRENTPVVVSVAPACLFGAFFHLY
jgi:hypothetical protein